MRRHCRDTPRQTIYLDDPVAANPSRLSQNRTSLRLRTRSTPTLAVAWMPAQPPSHWRRLLFADDSKRKFRADYLTRQVWVWNEPTASTRCLISHPLRERPRQAGALQIFGAFSAGSKANARFRRGGRGCGPLPVIDFICDFQDPPAIAPNRPEASADFAFSPD